jgi:hypothetical protein
MHLTFFGAPSGTSSAVPDLSARGAKLLAGAVGLRCRNFTDDVESVQRLLNLNVARFGLAGPLCCDGVIGKKTVDAIRAFQRAVLPAADPEGVVRPGDATLLSLCSALPGGISEPLLALVCLNAAEETLKALSPGIIDCMTRYDINTPLRQAHFLAQIGHESGEMRYRRRLLLRAKTLVGDIIILSCIVVRDVICMHPSRKGGVKIPLTT